MAGKTPFGAPGKLRPAVFAFKFPKASAPRLHQRNAGKADLAYWLPAYDDGSNKVAWAPSLRSGATQGSPLEDLPGEGL
jgi:hypothetical protein